jgi:hypothetical protein
VPVSEGGRSMRGNSCFPRRGVTRGCSGASVCGGGREPELGNFWIDPRWKTTSRAERLFGPDTIVEIKHAACWYFLHRQITGSTRSHVSSSKMPLRTKNTRIYPGSGPS